MGGLELDLHWPWTWDHGTGPGPGSWPWPWPLVQDLDPYWFIWDHCTGPWAWYLAMTMTSAQMQAHKCNLRQLALAIIQACSQQLQWPTLTRWGADIHSTSPSSIFQHVMHNVKPRQDKQCQEIIMAISDCWFWPSFKLATNSRSGRL